MENISTILLGGGSFWISEAVFKNVQGVLRVTPGYSGGYLNSPVYREVCSGKTGHIEVVQIHFNPKQINVQSILSIFFAMHDPTLQDKQGVEKGSQYNSYIVCQTLEQLQASKQFIKVSQENNTLPAHIYTTLELNQTFFEAEYYHHNYYQIQRDQPYAQRLITPILQEVESKFREYYTTPLLAS